MAQRPPPNDVPPRFSHPHTSHASYAPSIAQPAYAGGPGPALPPIQHPYPHATPLPDHKPLPPVRPDYAAHPQPPPLQVHTPRDASGYHYHHHYQQHQQRSTHGTPVSHTSYSHDSAHPQPQHTPTTPAHPQTPGPYPPASSTPGEPTLQPMDHGPPPPQWYPQPPNGLPMPGHGPPEHHVHPIMENHGQYPPPPQQPSSAPPMHYGYPPPTQMAINFSKKKQMRATQACDQCRTRKQKCDEGSPCSFCKENNLECKYRDAPVPKAERAMEKINSYIEHHGQLLERMCDKIDQLDARLRHHDSLRSNDVKFGVQDEIEPSLPDEPVRRPDLDDHRTAPHKLLLLWPTVRPLLLGANMNMNERYVVEAEDRGVLRLYGRGEGLDPGDGTQRSGAPGSPAHSDNSSESNPPTPSPEGVWGTGLAPHITVEIRRSEPLNGGTKPDGVLDLDVRTLHRLHESYLKHMHIMHPFLDQTRLKHMVENFATRYGTGRSVARSPFVVPNGVSLSEFNRHEKRRRLNGSSDAGSGTPESSTQPIKTPERSPGNAIIWLVLALGKICEHKEPLPGLLEDTKASAKVQHTTTDSTPPIPVRPSPMSPHSLTNSTPSSTEGFRVESASRSRRSSMEGPSTFDKPALGVRNVDIIPGMAYYAKAAEILGDQGDGNDLVHAQMFLLAGLYKGQLARVKESMSWITTAGRAVQILLEREGLIIDHYWDTQTQPGLKRKYQKGIEGPKTDKRKALVIMAFWTCLQLESDILAEMWLPQSGIKSFEDRVSLPQGIPPDESFGDVDMSKARSSSRDWLYYTAQLWLRRKLNSVHEEMYGSQSIDDRLEELVKKIRSHEHLLSAWRTMTNGQEVMGWNDADAPAEDILAARLRGKFYGARNIINRVFLDYALHIMPQVDNTLALPELELAVQDAAKDANGNPRDKNDVRLFQAIATMSQDEILAACVRCIDATKKSTVAFDYVPGRLIVTNIHGTAHAQFGNVLVLSAIHKSWMKNYVNADDLSRLLDRTVEFLRKLSPISKTAEADHRILQAIRGSLFPQPSHIYKDEATTGSNSFST